MDFEKSLASYICTLSERKEPARSVRAEVKTGVRADKSCALNAANLIVIMWRSRVTEGSADMETAIEKTLREFHSVGIDDYLPADAMRILLPLYFDRTWKTLGADEKVGALKDVFDRTKSVASKTMRLAINTLLLSVLVRSSLVVNDIQFSKTLCEEIDEHPAEEKSETYLPAAIVNYVRG